MMIIESCPFPELHHKDEFFNLPVAGAFEIGITPIASRHQPTGFFDDNGNLWVAILTDDGLKRIQR